MAVPVNQTFRMTDHDLNSGLAYTNVIEFITDLIASRTADSSKLWTVNASGASYVELKAPAGAADPNARILISGDTYPHVDNMAPTPTVTLSLSICFGYIAGFTGSVTDPATGDAYPGETWSKMILGGAFNNIKSRFRIVESNDVFHIQNVSATGSDTNGWVAGLIHEDENGDAQPGVAGNGAFSSLDAQLFESYNLNGNDLIFGTDTVYSTTDSRWRHFNGASWEYVFRVNHCTTLSMTTESDLIRYYIPMYFANILSRRVRGKLVHVRMGFRRASGTVQLDSSSVEVAFSLSGSSTSDATHSACWFISDDIS